MVTRKQNCVGQSVQMAPSCLFRREEDWTFSAEIGESTLHFLLYYRRPIDRSRIGAHVGTLSAKDKQRLVAEMQYVLGPDL